MHHRSYSTFPCAALLPAVSPFASAAWLQLRTAVGFVVSQSVVATSIDLCFVGAAAPLDGASSRWGVPGASVVLVSMVPVLCL